jgi:hypothetical protein
MPFFLNVKFGVNLGQIWDLLDVSVLQRNNIFDNTLPAGKRIVTVTISGGSVELHDFYV